ITDGIDSEANNVAEQVSGKYRVNVVGVGTEAGSPVPIGGGGFLKDNNGGIVIPQLDKAQLKELALAGGGQYVDIAVDNSDVKKLVQTNLSNMGDLKTEAFRELDLWRDEGQWFLLAALPFAALGFRRGWLGVVLLSLNFMPVNDAMAFEWADLWQRKDQQAQEALQQGDNKQAAELFENQDWKGTAYYRDGHYDKAAEYFSKSKSPEAKYNQANALAKQGELQQALDLYNEIISKQPDNQDAIFNRELIKKAMQQQKQQDQNQQQNSDQNKDSQNQQQQQSDEQSGKNQQDQQQKQDSNQQNSEQQSQDGQQSDSEQKQAQQAGQQQDDQDEQQKNAQQAEQDKKDNNDQQQKEEALQRQQESEKGDDAEKQAQQQESELNSEQRETQQATQQWLRRIPDDPGGLMREKFYRKSQRSRQREKVEQQW
ncbi:MAG: tetratricopeptide repeat protein, partial [Gammaproteobacteria bacterium]|nr:tetratricopeptide repeat protein [Gammaproteobacteria bacterium]